jgi:hypothetical protein
MNCLLIKEFFNDLWDDAKKEAAQWRPLFDVVVNNRSANHFWAEGATAGAATGAAAAAGA